MTLAYLSLTWFCFSVPYDFGIEKIIIKKQLSTATIWP